MNRSQSNRAWHILPPTGERFHLLEGAGVVALKCKIIIIGKEDNILGLSFRPMSWATLDVTWALGGEHRSLLGWRQGRAESQVLQLYGAESAVETEAARQVHLRAWKEAPHRLVPLGQLYQLFLQGTVLGGDGGCSPTLCPQHPPSGHTKPGKHVLSPRATQGPADPPGWQRQPRASVLWGQGWAWRGHSSNSSFNSLSYSFPFLGNDTTSFIAGMSK